MNSEIFNAAVGAYELKAGTKFNPKAFLFDMDGVIFDSMPRHSRAWRRAFADKGIDFPLREAYLQEGRTGRATIESMYERLGLPLPGDGELRDFYARKSRYFEEYGDPVPMKDADKVLDAVKAAGYAICLVTGSGQESLLSTLNHYYPGCFDKGNVVSAFDVKRGKPDPEPYLLALAKMNLAPSEAIVVENAPLGIQSATAAGIFTIGVNTGILQDEELLAAGADLLLPSMTELAALRFAARRFARG